MYKTLEVEFISRKNANYANNNGMHIRRNNVRIKRIVLDFHDAIVDSKKFFSLNMNGLFYLKLKTRRGAKWNMETVY